MLLADQIRNYVLNQIIIPARVDGNRFVVVRSGNVHKAMRLNNRIPAVCGAIGSYKFLEQANVKLISRKGPNQGMTVEWVFELH